MTRLPQIGWLANGRRLHLLDGPIDLIIEAHGTMPNIRAAYEAAIQRFTGLLDELCDELPELRKAAQPDACYLNGDIARRMHYAVVPFAAHHFITPMAAVAGSVAEEILGAMIRVADLDRAYVNNGGDIALHLGDGQFFTVGLVDRPDTPGLIGKTVIAASDTTRGIATSGWRGRSFSLGIADAVTVLARTAAKADAAATIIANAVDLPGHQAIVRRPASDIQPDSDLGVRLVTREVGRLPLADIEIALEAGASCARRLVVAGLMNGAALHLQGETRVVVLKNIDGKSPPLSSRGSVRVKIESLMHA
ncbi:UPF0280 family protein [Afipia birgiae]|jgi:ApbE superfamily uncharacterized protein (UPF0280 family)|uniref:UPF0280 family protein n=1 Tax=Afipia birgiae TaxID=151414 RepID=UPI00058B6FC9|nr:UPF0280 family protein [Afipia birgiae]MBX9822876.1 UPF0280 family protein [Afipia birgiae]